MDLSKLYGPGYAGYLHGQEQVDARNARGLQGLGMLSNMQRQAEQNKLIEQQLAMAKLKAQKESALIDMFLGGGQSNATAALEQGAAQGDVGPTVTNAERMGILNQQPAGIGARFTPQQWEALGYLNPNASNALVKSREAFQPKYDVKDGVIVGGRPGEVPAFQGFVPQVRMGQGGQTTMLVPDAQGGLRTTVPPGSVEAFSAYQQAEQAARGADPIARGRLDISRAEAVDKGIPVNGPAPNTGPVQFPSSGRTQPGQIAPQDVLRNELAAEQSKLQEARSRGDLNGIASAQRNIATLQREIGQTPTPQAAAQTPTLNVSPAQRRKLEEDRPQATLALRMNVGNLDRLGSAARALINHPGLPRITGLEGPIFDIPGGPAANARADLKALAAQVSANALQAMRDASKTGGAVGQVTEKEWPRLESLIASLATTQSTEQLKAKLTQIVSYTEEVKARMNEAYGMAYGGHREQIMPGEGMSAAPSRVVDFNSLGR